MHAKTVFVTIALALGSASSFASSFPWQLPQEDSDAPALTRAQVRADLVRASAAGELTTARLAYGQIDPASPNAGSSGLTRAEVVAELKRARANGELDNGGQLSRLSGADGFATARTTAEVRAEASGRGLARGNVN